MPPIPPAEHAETTSWTDLAEQLGRDGFCHLRNLLDADLLATLRPAADHLGERWSAKVGDDVLRAQGSMVDVTHMRDPIFAELIAYPPALAAFEHLGLWPATFTDGYVISKPARSPRLFWHFDWYGWQHPSAHEPPPIQIFVMYYLTDTTPANGCLRVIPGSHRRRHELHDLMIDGHLELRTATARDRPEFADWPDEVSVPVHAGDALIGDARLLHAAHANRSNERRSLITLWYQPRFQRLAGEVQATLVAKTQPLPDSWPPSRSDAVRALNPRYAGNAQPLPRDTSGPRSR